MNAAIVTQNQPQVNVQPKVITGTPWAWGFEDGAQNKSIYSGYYLFCGRKLTEYKQGWAQGRKARSN